jgi:hypothetical protein
MPTSRSLPTARGCGWQRENSWRTRGSRTLKQPDSTGPSRISRSAKTLCWSQIWPYRLLSAQTCSRFESLSRSRRGWLGGARLSGWAAGLGQDLGQCVGSFAAIWTA